MAGSGCDLCDLSELHALILEHLLAARVPQEALATVQRALEVNGQPSRLLQRCNDPKIPKEAAKRVVNLEGLGKNDGKHEVNTVKTVETEGGKSENQGFTSQNGYNGWMLAALGVFLLSMVFAPCVTYSEWYIDELFAAVRNADARGETPLLDLLQHDFWGNSLASGWTHKSYRPLVVLSYAAQYWMNGWDFRPQPLRTLNVALHSTNALLLLFLMRQLRISKKFAFLAAGCFAVHPVHAENVIYLVGRADSMATCCWLLALLVWLSGKSRTFAARILRIGLVTVLALVAGFCKESGFCVLLQLAAIELMGRRPVKGSLPFLLIFALTFLGRSWITQGTSAGFSFLDTPVQYRSDPWLRLATYLYFHAKYAQLMVWPWTLSWDYSYNALPDLSSTWRDLRVLAILMTYLGLSALASWTISQRNRRVLIGLSNIIIPFVPASNLFFVVGVTVGERLLYPCNVGAALVLAAAGSFPKSSRSKGGFGVLAATLLVTFTWLGALRTYQWSSRELLFGADAKSYPQSTKNRHQFGTVLHKMERYGEALHHFEAAEAIFDGTGLTQYCIGQILLETGRAKEAEEKFAKILSGHALGFGSHNLWSLYIDYGFSLVMMKRFEDAIQPIKESLRRNEDVPYGLNALGYAYIHLGMNEEARAAFQLAMKYDPENAYLENNLGIAKLLLGELNEGALHVAQAARMEPAVPAFAYNVNLLNEMAETQRWPQTNFALELYYNRGM